MTNLPGNEPRFFFSDQRFEVLGFSGTEHISRLYQFDLDLVSEQGDLKLEELIGQPASLVILGWNGQPRYVHGLITRLEVSSALSRRTIYHATLEPPHVKLTLRHKLRVFQDLTTQEIIEQVLQEGGVTKLEWRLEECPEGKPNYYPRSFCVQYRESDLDFVSRLLQEEGISFFFEQLEDELKTVFTDNSAAFLPIQPPLGQEEPDSTLIYNANSSLVPASEHVQRFAYGEQLSSGWVQLRDYSFEKPRQPVEGDAYGAEPTLEIYDYPGAFVNARLADRLAWVRLDAAQSSRKVGSGQSNCARLLPGHRFSLGGYPLEQLNNQEYLLVEVSHHGQQGQVMGEEGDHEATTYSNSFTVVPAQTPFCPAENLERPAVLGTYTATVVGPPGEPIYVDSYGRVKIRFHWDREHKSTAWVRVAQSWAGAGFGSQLLPRVGQEVLVGFLEGDPDRPLVIGRVYNGEHRVPYELPQNETCSTLRSNSAPPQTVAPSDETTGLVDPLYSQSGYNELRFEDKQGQEELYLHAQKDYQLVVENDRFTTVGHDHSEEVLRDQTLLVENSEELQVTSRALHTAKTILLESAETITFHVGKSRIQLTSSGGELRTERLVWSGQRITDIRGGVVKINCAQPLPPELPAGENWIDLSYLHNDGTPVAGAKYKVLDADGVTELASGVLDNAGKALRVMLPVDKNSVVVRYEKDPQKYEPFVKPKAHGLQAEGEPESYKEFLANLDDIPD